MVGVALSGMLVTRFGFARAVAAGLAAMTAGVGALGIVAWPAALLSVGCYGVGLGITIPATNLLVAEAAPERRAEALNILNLAWGIGAVAAPPVFAWFAARDGVNLFLFALAASLAAVMLAQISLTRTEPTVDSAPEASRSPAPAVRWRSAAFLVYAALFFVYVGTENAFAGWVAAFAQRMDTAAIATSTPAFFWGRVAAWSRRRSAVAPSGDRNRPRAGRIDSRRDRCRTGAGRSEPCRGHGEHRNLRIRAVDRVPHYDRPVVASVWRRERPGSSHRFRLCGTRWRHSPLAGGRLVHGRRELAGRGWWSRSWDAS